MALPDLEDEYGFQDWSVNDVREEEDRGLGDFADAFREALQEQYADASDDEIIDALVDVFDEMSPAESFNFASALNQIGKTANQVVSDPTFAAVARTAVPAITTAVGTAYLGPAGGALGNKLGQAIVGGLPAPAAARPPAPQPVATPAGISPTVVPSTNVPTPPPVAGGSSAAAQALILTQLRPVLLALLAAALGVHGRLQIDGVPVAQLLGMLSQTIGQAAADADELAYLMQVGDATESVSDVSSIESDRWLYVDLLEAEDIELAEAVEYDGIGQ